jgi:hypothetical protein
MLLRVTATPPLGERRKAAADKKRQNPSRELLGDHCGQSQESRLELGKRLSRGLLPCKQSSLPTHISATVTASLWVRMKS